MFLLHSSVFIALLAAITSGDSIKRTTTMEPVRLWSRIRVSDNASDIAKLYPLLQEYIRYPERANSVKEFIYNPALRDTTYYGDNGKASCESSLAREKAREPDDEEINNVLLQLALPKEEQYKWLKHITRLKPDVAIRNSSQMNIECWHSYDISQDAESAQYAGLLLMLLCPQIEKLTYASNYGPAKAILLRNNYADLQIKALQHLREVRLIPNQEWWADDERYYNRVDVSSLIRLFHRLPSLETIKTDAIDIFEDDSLSLLPGISALKTIEFTHAEAATSDLGPIIRVAKQLEHLTIKEGGRATFDSGTYLRFPRTMMLALSCHKDSLRSLDLDMDQHVYYDRQEDILYKEEIDEELEALREAREYSANHDSQGDEEASIHLSESEESSDYYAVGDQYVERDVQESVGPLHWSKVPELRPWTGAFDLRDFSKLTKLGIGIKYLLGTPEIVLSTHLVDVLPPNLQAFSLYGYVKGVSPRYDAEIDMLLEQKNDRFPKLTELHGIHELIDNGYTVKNPDDETDQLSPPLELNDDWLDVDEEWVEVENVK